MDKCVGFKVIIMYYLLLNVPLTWSAVGLLPAVITTVGATTLASARARNALFAASTGTTTVEPSS